MITDYNKYLNKLKITEALRTFPLYLSNRFRDILSNIDHEISTDLLSMHSDIDTRVTKTFVDVHDTKPDLITFCQPNKAKQSLGLEIENDEELSTLDSTVFDDITDDSNVYKRYRSEYKLGRLVKEIFGDKYPNSLSGGQNKKDVESFVNLYRALYLQDRINFDLFDLVTGDDISKWYHYSKYASNDDSSLANSCMSHVDSDFFQIYTQNPNKVSLLIYYSDDTKQYIKGRAIVWKLDTPEDRVFMDRIYVNNYSDEQLFINYAISKNWIYKESQSMGHEIELIDKMKDYEGRMDLTVTLSDHDYTKFPYCDTMTFFNSNTNVIANSVKHNYNKELTDTEGRYYDNSGDYPDEDEYENYVYSNYHERDIPESDAVHCEFSGDDDWVLKREALRVYNTGIEGRVYAVPGNPNVALQHFIYGTITMNKYFPSNRCIWSDYLDSWLFEDSVVNVWLDKDKTEVGLDHKKRKDIEFFEIDGENYSKNLVDVQTKQLL